MKWLSNLLSRLCKVPKDPFYNCALSKNCAHVDGMLCNTSTCEDRAKHAVIIQDEELLEQLYREFDEQRKIAGERVAFKGKMRYYAARTQTRSAYELSLVKRCLFQMQEAAKDLAKRLEKK